MGDEGGEQNQRKASPTRYPSDATLTLSVLTSQLGSLGDGGRQTGAHLVPSNAVTPDYNNTA